MFSRALNVVRGDPGRIQYAGMPKMRDLAVGIAVDPNPVKISARKFNVTLAIRNNAKKQATNLNFNTTQRIEVVVLDGATVVDRWSTDHPFSPESGYLVINPKEEAAYTVTLSTRELAAGRTYTVEGFFVGYDRLVGRTTISTIP